MFVHDCLLNWQVTEANIPSEASIALPKVHVSAEYVLDGVQPANGPFFGQGNFPKLIHYFKVGMDSS